MLSKRVRIWNSELAHWIDSQLTTQWDRAIFRKLLTQNELDESQLRSLLRLWRAQSDGKSLCEFLMRAGLLLVEMRKPDTLGDLAYDSENEELLVLLTPRGQVELTRASRIKVLITRFIQAIQARVFANSFSAEKTEKIRLTTTMQTFPQAESSARTNLRSVEATCNPVDKQLKRSTCPEPKVETADEFDPYATVC